MSAFPDLPHGIDSRREANDGHLVDYGEDGVARVRVMYAATQWILTLQFPNLNATDESSLLAHYAAHKWVSFSYTWPSESPDRIAANYTCVYLSAPQRTVAEATGRRHLVVTLAGTIG